MTSTDALAPADDLFRITADPGRIFASAAHRRARAAVLTALAEPLSGRGAPLIALIGDAGAGKTTLLYDLDAALAERGAAVFLHQAPLLGPADLVAAWAARLGCAEPERWW